MMTVVLLATVSSPKNRFLRWIMVLCVGFLGVRYIAWRTFDTVNFESGIFVLAFSLLLLLGDWFMFIVNNLSTWLLFLYATDRSPEADEAQKAVLSGEFVPAVDIFLPTYNEPVSILRRTVAACQQMDYPNKTIYILDDNRRPEMRALAEEMGVGYFDRPDNRHFKAGNINNALFKTPNPSPYVCFFDCDFVPVPWFLTRIMGFFQNPKIGMVQTPLNFYNEDLIQCNLGLGGSITSEQDQFFRTIQPGRDAFNAVICCGTSWITPRHLLEEMGGIPTDTITEDMMTSYTLQTQGFDVIYLNEALTFGEAPNRSTDHLKQRTRWCRGSLQALFIKNNPLLSKKLNFAQRYFYAIAFGYWFTMIPRLILVFLPLLFFFFGILPMKASVETLMSFFIPFNIASLAFIAWFNRGRRSPFWSEIYEFIPAFVLIPNIFAALVNPFGLGFQVTTKGVTSDKPSINWQIAKPCLIIIGLYGLALVHLFLNWSWMSEHYGLGLNLFWSVYCITVFWLALMACIDVPQRRENARMNLSFDYQVTIDGITYSGKSSDISESGLLVTLTGSLKSLLTQQVTSELPIEGELTLVGQKGLHKIPVTLLPRKFGKTGQKDSKAFLKYQSLSPDQYACLVRAMFGKLGTVWEDRTVPEWKAIWLFLKSAFRMYPLAKASR